MGLHSALDGLQELVGTQGIVVLVERLCGQADQDLIHGQALLPQKGILPAHDLGMAAGLPQLCQRPRYLGSRPADQMDA